MAWDDTIGRRLKFKDLQMLLAVVEAGGIGKAAERLNYSQPAVSKAIAGLEHAFGKRLLERGRKGIELTSYGDALVKCGSAVFDELRRGLASIEFLADPTAGKVRVGCTDPVSTGLVTSVIDRLARQHPRIEFQVDVRGPASSARTCSEGSSILLSPRLAWHQCTASVCRLKSFTTIVW